MRVRMGCAIADYDNDGDQDLFVANYGADAFFPERRRQLPRCDR